MKAATGAEQVNDTVKQFQSTPPVKAATAWISAMTCTMTISIHAAREGGDGGTDKEEVPNIISIHAARDGGDRVNRVCKAHG